MGGREGEQGEQLPSHFVSVTVSLQLPSDATRPLEQEDFSPQVRDVSERAVGRRWWRWWEGRVSVGGAVSVTSW